MPIDEEGRELQKHTLHLFEGDFDRIADLFPNAKPSRVIRLLVHDLIQRTKGEKVDVKVDIE